MVYRAWNASVGSCARRGETFWTSDRVVGVKRTVVTGWARSAYFSLIVGVCAVRTWADHVAVGCSGVPTSGSDELNVNSKWRVEACERSAVASRTLVGCFLVVCSAIGTHYTLWTGLTTVEAVLIVKAWWARYPVMILWEQALFA